VFNISFRQHFCEWALPLRIAFLRFDDYILPPEFVEPPQETILPGGWWAGVTVLAWTFEIDYNNEPTETDSR